MSGEPLPTQAEAANWLLIGNALKAVREAQGNEAYFSIVKRLASGLIQSTAENYRRDSGALQGFTVIGQKVWETVLEHGHLYTASFWTSNDFTVKIYESYDRARKHEFYTVRVDPAGIRKMLPETASTSASRRTDPAEKLNVLGIPQDEPDPEPAQKGPPVSKAALAAWFEAYSAAFKGPDDTEAKALESARGCFPGRAISRDAVRLLRGAQKRGPKGSAAK